MDRGKKKRGKAEGNSDAERSSGSRSRSPAQGGTTKRGKHSAAEIPDIFPDGGVDSIEKSGNYKPLGVFEFPWQNEMEALSPELDGCGLLDVFFSSLVDGCSAAIGFPGDRFSPPRSTQIVITAEADGSSPSDGDADGVDCIWSCALRQPLSAVDRRSPCT